MGLINIKLALIQVMSEWWTIKPLNYVIKSHDAGYKGKFTFFKVWLVINDFVEIDVKHSKCVLKYHT